MPGLREAIEGFRKKRFDVYQADSQQLQRDASAATRAAADHVGRWFLELLQNSDDAKANKVHVRVAGGAIYVADDGEGLKPSAVEAISGTDFSDKTRGTIGRKGIGFKAVYTVSQNPQVFSLDAEGLEFCRHKAEAWLRENNINFGSKVPYEWLPFFVSREEVERHDPALAELREYHTVVKLPSAAAPQLDNFPAWGLLPFNHVRKLEVHIDKEQSFTLAVSDSWVVNDSRRKSAVLWRVLKPPPETPPDEALSNLDDDERKRVMNNGIGFLVAAPLNESGVVHPTEEYPPVHVFYETEEKAPVRLLLHAEFLVKSDRTALIPIERDPFNGWVADRLAELVIAFVQGQYDQRDRGAHLRLLLPLEERDTHPVAKSLWDRLAACAKESLRLPDASGELKLSCAEARLLSVSAEHGRARQILEAAPDGAGLLHEALDDDDEARKALEALGCQKITNRGVLEAIGSAVSVKADDPDWIWTCWEWLAAWAAEGPYGDEHKKRLDRVKELPLLPMEGNLRPVGSLSGIVTWRDKDFAGEVPEWLRSHLSFVDDWFRDRITKLPEKAPVRELLSELDIKPPGKDALKRGLEKAIVAYWKKPDDNPARFFEYLMRAGWEEEGERSSEELCWCPVKARIEGKSSPEWVRAGEAYFGREWDNPLLTELYEGVAGIAWVQPLDLERDKVRRVLEWLQVISHPRLLKDKREHPDEHQRLSTHISGDAYPPHSPPEPLFLDRLHADELTTKQAVSLFCLLSENWSRYYGSGHEISICCHGPRGGWRSSQTVPALWWEQIKNNVKPPLVSNRARPAPPSKCWLPDRRTSKAVGELLPTIDIEAFGEHKAAVKKWLLEFVRIRTGLEAITVGEWWTMLSKDIPSIVGEEKANDDVKLRDRVAAWYRACFDSLAEQENAQAGILRDVPLLCQKGDRWEYVTEAEVRWLEDHNEAAREFRGEIWRCVSPDSRATKHFGVRSLDKSVKEELLPADEQGDAPEHLKCALKGVTPFLYAWKRHRAPREDPDKLRERLSNLNVCVVGRLEVELFLEGIGRRRIKRKCGVSDDRLLILAEKATPGDFHPYLARGLAEFLGRKDDSDFYQNLLRCRDDKEHQAALVAKEIPGDEIARLLREFRKERAEIEPQEIIEEEESPHPEPEAQPGTDPKVEPGTSPEPASGEIPTPEVPSGAPSEGREGPEEEPGQPGSTPPRPPLRLENPETADYVLASAAPSGKGSDRGGGGGGGDGSGEGRSLTQEERDSIEDSGRVVVERELRGRGYHVEQMPRRNPGYDIRATRDDETLLVEVKAHLGSTTHVGLTARELEEYHRCRHSGGSEKWQLWNVGNLAEDAGQVEIACYDTIPDEALRGKNFSVDLRLCEPIPK